MSDPEDRPSDATTGKHGQARQLADRAIRLEAEGDQDGADRLFAEATQIDPDAVAAALDEAGSPRPAAVESAGSDRDTARISREIKPGADAPDRAGIKGSGSGADNA